MMTLMRYAKIINIFFIILIITSTVKICSPFFSSTTKYSLKDNYKAISLTNTPNIYLFFLESVSNIDTLKKDYKIDTTYIESFFKKNNFKIYNNTFSNWDSTLLSMSSTYAMRTDGEAMNFMLFGSRSSMDAAEFIRQLIAGSQYNHVLRTLKSNSYKTVSLYGVPYYFTERQEYLDESDIDHPMIYPLSLYPLYSLNTGMEKVFRERILPKFRLKFSGTLQNRVEQAMQEGLAHGKPFFLSFKGGASHTPSLHDHYNWHNRKTWIAQYQGYLKHGMDEAFRIVDSIISKDPNSIIILMGDHGPHTLRGAVLPKDASTLASMETALAANKITIEELARDKLGIMLAIRMPNGNNDISHGHVISPANLFRFIFASINNTPEILQDIDKSRSRILTAPSFPLVIDGKVQHAP
jgi:hypothetical protein